MKEKNEIFAATSIQSNDNTRLSKTAKKLSRTKKILLDSRGEPKIWENWAGNVNQVVAKWVEPRTEAEIVETVEYAIQNKTVVRVIGVGHSFNEMNCAPKEGIGMSLMFYKKFLNVDLKNQTVTCQAGINLVLLIEQLEEKGLTLPNMPIVNSVTLGGALSTCAHGSGANHPCLSELMTGCRIINGKAKVVEVTENNSNKSMLPAVRVSLGALGIFSTITLKVVPAFKLNVREIPLHLTTCLENITFLKEEFEYFKAWWVPHTGYVHAFLIDRDAEKVDQKLSFEDADEPMKFTKEEKEFINSDEGMAFQNDMYLLSALDPPRTVHINSVLRRLLYTPKRSCEESSTILVNGHWVAGNESKGCRFDVLEYTIPADRLTSALNEFITILRQKRLYLGFPVDIRFSKRDNSWLSPAYGMDVAWVGIPAKRPHGQETPHSEVFMEFERIMVKNNGRPHWAKQHTQLGSFFEAHLPHWRDFLSLRRQWDPHGVFLNDYLQNLFQERPTSKL